MAKFRELGGKKKKDSAPIGNINVIETSKGVVEFTPTFLKGDNVCIKKESMRYSSVFQQLKDIPLIVDYCKVADLGNIVVEVIYFQKTDSLIKNPHLVKHFILCK